jgi:integrase/recombinase XerD
LLPTFIFSVHFWLKKSVIKKDGTLPIYVRITVDGHRADVSTKRSIDENRWCETSRRNIPKFSGAKGINDYLSDIYSKLVACHKQLSDDGDVISAQAIKPVIV